jgi:hypothetical protein
VSDIYEVLIGDGDIPGHALLGTKCQYPECEDGGYSLTLGPLCETHNRSVYFCVNQHILWCDGGPPDWEYHRVSCVADQ